MNVNKTELQKILTCLLYGVTFCAAVLLPWVLIEELITRIPGANELTTYVQELGYPTLVNIILAVTSTIVVLILLGYVVKQYLWKYLAKLPLFNRFTSSIDRISNQLNNVDPENRERVVWISWPSETVKTLGIIMETDTTDRDWLTVIIFSNSGQITSGLLRRVKADQVTYPNWTIDEALEFVLTATE